MMLDSIAILINWNLKFKYYKVKIFVAYVYQDSDVVITLR